MRRVWAVVLAAFLAAPGSAQPTPSCPGDCNLDGIVAINELLLGVNFFLAGLPPSGCDELDDDRDGVLRVNELVLAVVKALGIEALAIGAQIDPGVPWTMTLGEPRIALALKSGNFGADDFFEKALAMIE